MKKLEIEPGQKCHGFEFVKDSYNSDGYHCYGIWICKHCKCAFHKRNDIVVKGNLKSCGCKSHANKLSLSQNLNPDWGWEIIYKEILERIKRKQILCEITPSDIKAQYFKQDGKCVYSGIKIIPPTRYTNLKGKHVLSVDRIDSTKNYTVDNIQLVTKDVNFIKQSLSHDRFLELIKMIVENKK